MAIVAIHLSTCMHTYLAGWLELGVSCPMMPVLEEAQTRVEAQLFAVSAVEQCPRTPAASVSDTSVMNKSF